MGHAVKRKQERKHREIRGVFAHGYDPLRPFHPCVVADIGQTRALCCVALPDFAELSCRATRIRTSSIQWSRQVVPRLEFSEDQIIDGQRFLSSAMELAASFFVSGTSTDFKDEKPQTSGNPCHATIPSNDTRNPKSVINEVCGYIPGIPGCGDAHPCQHPPLLPPPPVHFQQRQLHLPRLYRPRQKLDPRPASPFPLPPHLPRRMYRSNFGICQGFTPYICGGRRE